MERSERAIAVAVVNRKARAGLCVDERFVQELFISGEHCTPVAPRTLRSSTR
jgi:hypothetical protein